MFFASAPRSKKRSIFEKSLQNQWILMILGLQNIKTSKKNKNNKKIKNRQGPQGTPGLSLEPDRLMGPVP